MAKRLGDLFDRLNADRKKCALARGWRPIPPWAFVTCNGTPYSQRNVLRDWKRVLRRAWPKKADDDPDPDEWVFTPHSMRHSFATMHIKQGKSPKWLQQQMGHSSIKVTLDVYGDWFKLTDQRAADELGDALLGDAVSGNTFGNRQ